jgi:superfamily II RNA helicase
MAFPFALDEFQLAAIDALDAGKSVVVCAPTGSGKTVVGEYAIQAAVARGRRVFYTTPLKALSNQKFRDFSRQYGEEAVGLLTGDISIRGHAPVVVMTTEVFRNMLYGVGPDGAGLDLSAIAFVVLDECHYINDAGRGTVWEEAILCCPREIQLVALSATIRNPEQLASWMAVAHGPTELVVSEERPVPLAYHTYSGGRLAPLRLGAAAAGHAESRPLLSGEAARQVRPWETVVDPDEVVTVLAPGEMLPAIYFLFSRQGCESALVRCAHLELLSLPERDEVEARTATFLAERPSLRYHPHLRYLPRGLAVHHAGLLPGWRAFVERLFQAGLVKVVFATETLAAGINMPARTTVISALSKPGAMRSRGSRVERRPLTASEFHQMSGRAGRRGMDRIGHVVVIVDPRQSLSDAARLAAAPPDPLFSRFSPTYSLVLNLLRRFRDDEIHDLLRRSFSQYLASLGAPSSGHPQGVPLQAHGGEGAALDGSSGGTPRGCPGAVSATAGGYWERFLRLREVLEEFGYVREGRPTEATATAAAIRAENELLVAEVVRRDLELGTGPAEFAGGIVALVADAHSRPSMTSGARGPAAARGGVGTRPSARTNALLARIDEQARTLHAAQRRHRVDVPTRTVAWASALTEQWAGGAAWEEVMAATDLDEGDVVYLMRSLIDLLRQIAAAPGVPAETRRLAQQAAHAVDRDPVDAVL